MQVLYQARLLLTKFNRGPMHCVALMLLVYLPRRYYCALRNGSVRHLKHEHSQHLWLRSGRLLHTPSLDRPSFLVLGFNFTIHAVLPSPRTWRSRLHASTSWLARRATCLVALTAIIYLLIYRVPASSACSLISVITGLPTPVCLSCVLMAVYTLSSAFRHLKHNVGQLASMDGAG